MGVMDRFEDDPSSALGLDHAWKTEENPLLLDTSWNDKNNERERQRLEEAGEALPPKVLQDGSLEDRDLKEQIREELAKVEKRRPDLNFPDQLALAKDAVSARQKQTHRNQGAYEDVERALQRVRKSNPNLPLVEQQRLAREQASEVVSTEPAIDSDRIGASIQSLMKHPGAKGGGRSSRKNKNKKKGTWICKDCHLEFCEHRPKQSRGPKPKEGLARRVRKTAYLSDYTMAVITERGLTSSDFLAIAALALKEQRPLLDVLESWKQRLDNERQGVRK